MKWRDTAGTKRNTEKLEEYYAEALPPNPMIPVLRDATVMKACTKSIKKISPKHL